MDSDSAFAVGSDVGSGSSVGCGPNVGAAFGVSACSLGMRGFAVDSDCGVSLVAAVSGVVTTLCAAVMDGMGVEISASAGAAIGRFFDSVSGAGVDSFPEHARVSINIRAISRGPAANLLLMFPLLGIGLAVYSVRPFRGVGFVVSGKAALR